jgi:hypothetical protein
MFFFTILLYNNGTTEPVREEGNNPMEPKEEIKR